MALHQDRSDKENGDPTILSSAEALRLRCRQYKSRSNRQPENDEPQKEQPKWAKFLEAAVDIGADLLDIIF